MVINAWTLLTFGVGLPLLCLARLERRARRLFYARSPQLADPRRPGAAACAIRLLYVRCLSAAELAAASALAFHASRAVVAWRAG